MPSKLRERGKADVFSDGEFRYKAILLSVLRHQSNPDRNCFSNRIQLDALTSYLYLSGIRRTKSSKGLHKLCTPRTEKAVYPDDLSSIYREAYFIQCRSSCLVRFQSKSFENVLLLP